MTSTQKKMLRYVTIRLKWKTGLLVYLRNEQDRTQDFFHQGGSKAYVPKNVPNIQIIINDILKIIISSWGSLTAYDEGILV
jgi:hypothetical protein